MEKKELIEFKEVIKGAEDALESYQRNLKDVWEGLHNLKILTGIKGKTSNDEMFHEIYSEDDKRVIDIHLSSLFTIITNIRIKLGSDYLGEMDGNKTTSEDLDNVI